MKDRLLVVPPAGLPAKHNGIIAANSVRINDSPAQAGYFGGVICISDDINAPLCLQVE